MNAVYMLIDEKRTHALVKIGFASNLSDRMDSYMTENPEIRCISYIHTMKKTKQGVERTIQKEFSAKGFERVQGRIDGRTTEWFKVSYESTFYGELLAKGLNAFQCAKNRKNYGEYLKG